MLLVDFLKILLGDFLKISPHRCFEPFAEKLAYTLTFQIINELETEKTERPNLSALRGEKSGPCESQSKLSRASHHFVHSIVFISYRSD